MLTLEIQNESGASTIKKRYLTEPEAIKIAEQKNCIVAYVQEDVKMSSSRICILCGNSIMKTAKTDPYVCRDCERENAEARFLNEWMI